MTTRYNETELICLIKENSRNAFSYVYANYGPALLMVISKVVKDQHTAEDVLQEAFVSIWKNIAQYNSEKGCFYTWMRNIAKNKAIDFTRCSVSNMRRRTDTQEGTLHNQITTEAQHKTDHIGMTNLIGALEPQHQRLINLVYYRGHTMEEVAKALDIPLGTIKSRVRRALRLLREDFNFAA